jgi:hypothetical protein
VRYYRIVIVNKQGDVLIPNFEGQPGFTPRPYDSTLSTYTSLNAGANVFTIGGSNPAAQTLEVDIALTSMDASLPGSFVRVWGIGLGELAQAQNLNSMQVYVYGGMAKGLPLANPAQSGLLASGQIYSSFGNWTGTDMKLDIFLTAGGSAPSSSDTTGQPGTTLAPTSNDAPANLVFQWQPGQPLLTPLINTLQTAYPQYSVVGVVHEGLVWSGATATGFFSKLGQLAQYVRQKSLSIIGGYAPATVPQSYPGVSMTLFNNVITISDGTTQTTPKPIQFVELLGQPTWVDSYTVNCACTMRADIHVGDYITLPPLAGITTAGSNNQFFQPTPSAGPNSGLKNNSIFTGTFQVINVRHVGDSRDASGLSWVTVFNLIQASPPTQTVSTLPTIWSSTVGPNKYGFAI